MALTVPLSRQRIPMVDGSTLEDRTRPLEGSGSYAARLRYFEWPTWSRDGEHVATGQRQSTQARLGRR